jgi:uncharacterized membrane protein
MDLSPRLVAVLAFVALLPFGVYTAASGEMTPVMAVVGVVDVTLVAVSIVVMFGPAPADTDHAATH